MLPGDCLKSLSFTAFRHSENALCLTWRTHRHFSKFASLGCATGDTAMILVPRATHAQPGPQRNASASQHTSTSAQQGTNNKKPTTTTATNNNTATNTTKSTINNQQPVYSPKNSNNTATRNTKQQQQQLFHQAASRTAKSPASMPALAHKTKVTGSSNNSCNEK